MQNKTPREKLSGLITAGLGFEPRLDAPEASVLPLDDPAYFYTFKYLRMAIKPETIPIPIPTKSWMKSKIQKLLRKKL